MFYRHYIPRFADKLVPLFLLLRENVVYQLGQQPKDPIFEINECLFKASKLSLKLPLPEHRQ